MSDDNHKIELFFHAVYYMVIGMVLPHISEFISDLTSIPIYWVLILLVIVCAVVFTNYK